MIKQLQKMKEQIDYRLNMKRKGIIFRTAFKTDNDGNYHCIVMESDLHKGKQHERER
ncbi:unnamed protein product [marine sediment metagenome]|uniref:Uncharacterized protein n=1 Tax=marine sediment metagenome TaxID=412755 RepID=X0WKR8_9ZZZZ